ncbi:MAG: hypothetical protein ACYTFA_11355 [Planctomycetota bacterium]|jgi:hypothetical protein
MVVELAGLDRIIEPMRTPLEQYARLVADLAGSTAKGLTLFGAITTGRFDLHRHTARSALVVDRVDLGMLRRLAEHGTRLGKARIAAPLIMTADYIKASLDTFPLELIEIKQQHMTLFGEDLFADLSFDDAHVRLQCERELKVILIGLRQGLLAAAGREKLLGALEQDMGEGLMRTLRGILWLKGDRDPKPAAQVLDEIEKTTGVKLTGIRVALDPGANHGWPEFESLYADVEALEKVADAS